MARPVVLFAALAALAPLPALAEPPGGFSNPSPIDYSKPFLFDGVRIKRETPREHVIVRSVVTIDKDGVITLPPVLNRDDIPQPLRDREFQRETIIPIQPIPDAKDF
ncbi:MAG: hypothetical protein ACJ8DO_03080, partial [Microvirga sp.]